MAWYHDIKEVVKMQKNHNTYCTVFRTVASFLQPTGCIALTGVFGACVTVFIPRLVSFPNVVRTVMEMAPTQMMLVMSK